MRSIVLHTGPGHHAFLLARLLKELGYPRRVISYYPDWQIGDATDQIEKSNKLYRPLVNLMWALWRRLPYFRRYEHPKTWHFSFYDWLSKQHLPPQGGLLWGWAGMSLYSLRKARKLGLRTLLEMPMIHPRAWQAIAYSVYGGYPDLASYPELLPESYIVRIEAELAEADAIQVLSSFAHESYLKHGLPASKLHVLSLGLDEKIFQPKQAISHNPFRILYVGRITLLKGIQHLLEAYRKLALPKSELWLVGPLGSEMKPILARYEGLFFYKGAYKQEKLVDLYNQATIFVFPTLLDAFGLVLLEAMACGRPVIATTHSAGPDLITGQEGYVIPPQNTEALMEAILGLYEKPALAIQMGEAARARILSAYTLEHYKRRLAQYLEMQINLSL